MRFAGVASRYNADTDPACRPHHRTFTRDASKIVPAVVKRRIRFSFSACRAPDRPWSSRSCRRIAWSKGRRSFPTSGDRPEKSEISVVRRGTERTSAANRAKNICERASVQRRTDRPFFIDKLPNNWIYVPFIQLVLPNAKIIDARRHPLGCCFSNFRQHFARGQAFTYDLTMWGATIRLCAADGPYRRSAAGQVHRVIYERMVDDTEAEVRALLDHCGLEFEPAVPRVLRNRARRSARQLGAGAPAYLSRCDRGVAAPTRPSWAA